MSHDTDKLIRQLSLVAFLMAERRPLTARDVKGNVEGYSEMSDEAFARRFDSDRAELRDLGVPLHSQRDEFTGEELYTLRSETYFLPKLELTDDELAALQTCFYLLEGKFAYAEPLRLALQNLALGRPTLADQAPSATACESRCAIGRLGRDARAAGEARDGDPEAAHGEVRLPGDDQRQGDRAHAESLRPAERSWGLVRDRLRPRPRRDPHLPRIPHPGRDPFRHPPRARFPTSARLRHRRLPGRAAWQFGDPVGEARIEVRPETAWWVERAFGPSGRLEDQTFVTEYSNLPMLASWVLRQDGLGGSARAGRPAPRGRGESAPGPRRHQGAPSKPAREVTSRQDDPAVERSSGPVTPERFGLLQALLAYLLAACGEQKDAVVPAAEIVERFQIPADELEDHLSLLNLVNFGGGCYAVYAELHGDEVHIDKELWGDTFRSAPRLTPLQARAIRLALEFVGPLIAAEAHRPLDRVRKKLEETFGEFELSQTPQPNSDKAAEGLVAILTDAIRRRRLVELEYLKEEEGTPTVHLVEPYTIERRLPHWYVHTWDRTRDDERSFRLDRMRSATLLEEEFEPREGFEPGLLEGALVARVLYSPAVARWEVERGARPLADGSAINEQKIGSKEWLVGEILRYRGEAELLEPPELRRQIAKRAQTLGRELGVTRLRAPA